MITGASDAKYYFHVREHDTLIRDLEGVEVPGVRAAFEEAQKTARDLMSERVKHGKVIDGQGFEIYDTQHEAV